MRRINPANPFTFPPKEKSRTSVPPTGRSQARGRKGRQKVISGSPETSVKTMKQAMLGVAMITFLSSAAPMLSQRPFSATYDSSRQVKLQGVVTRLEWVNPTAFLFIDVRDGTGTVA